MNLPLSANSSFIQSTESRNSFLNNPIFYPPFESDKNNGIDFSKFGLPTYNETDSHQMKNEKIDSNPQPMISEKNLSLKNDSVKY